MSTADDIINGTYKTNSSKKKKRNYADEIINGTFKADISIPKPAKKEEDIAPVRTTTKKEDDNDFWDKVGYTAKSFGSGILSGLSGIFEAGTSEVANNAKKGKEEESFLGQLGDLFNSTQYILNPTKALTDTVIDTSKQGYKILTDKNSSALEKGINFATNATSAATNAIPIKALANEAIQTAGYLAPENTSENIMDFSNKVTKPVYDLQQDLYEEGQQYGGGTQFVGETANVVGRMIPSIATSLLTKNPQAGMAVMGASVKGSSTTEALNKGVELEEAVKIGDTKAMIEVGTEMLTGGINVFGKGAVDDIITKGIDKKVKNEVLNYLTQKGVGVAGELVEETISDVLNTAIDKGTVDPNASYSLKDWGEMAPVTILSTLVINALTGGYGSASFKDNAARMKQNQAQAQGLQEEIAKKQEELNNSQDVREKQIIQETIDGLNEELNELTNAGQITDGQQQRFTYEAQENDSEYKRRVYESASKYFDNTEDSHKFVDVIANMAEERGTVYEFTNTEELKKGNHNVGDNVINGFAQDGKVVINVDSPKALNVIVGHETTHLLEGTKEYDALKQVAIEYAKSKGEYDTRYKQIERIYEGQNANIEKELTADIVGEYLFTDYNFVQELSVKQPTIFEKIKNFISDLVVKFKGTEQEKQLRQLQRSFEKAYKAQGTQITDTKYSMNEKAVQGLENYSRDEIKQKVTDYINTELEIYDNYSYGLGKEAEIVGLEIIGSRNRGNAKKRSDLDIVVEFKGDSLREDSLFNALNDYKRQLKIDGIRVDINPIVSHESGTLAEYMESSNAYDKEILSKQSTTDNQGRKLTKEQQEYFKDSKVRDENGNLLEVYHGSNENFTIFNKGTKNGWLGKGIYFTANKNYARENGKNITKAYLNVKNPFIVKGNSPSDVLTEIKEIYPNVNETNIAEILEANGYDGIVYNHWDSDVGKMISVFNSNQIKNIDNTKPTTNPDIRYSLSEDTKGRKLSKEQIERYKYVSDKLKDENGNLKVYYHGTQRADRVGTLFDPNRATSGPMAFFTDSQEIAQNYSTNKSDTSLSREYDTEYDLFKVDGQDLDSYWNLLSYAEKQKINKEGNNVGFDDDWENVVYGENASENSFSDMYKWYLKNETNGNGIKALYQVWIQDGNIMDDDLYKFQEVLEKAGVKNVEFLDPYKTESKVYETYLNIKNPFDTSNMSEDIINQFKEASKTATIGEQYSADAWDKSNIAPEDWISKLESDIEEGTTHAWTVIPDWVTDVLKANGYDGIVDTGGKNGGVGHQVVIPFYSEQVKDVNNQNPTDNPNIDMSLSAQNEEIAPTGNWNVYGKDIKYQVEEAIAPLQETIANLTEQVQTLQENIVPTAEQYKEVKPTKPTLEEVQNLMDIKENRSGSEYANAFFALRDKYGQANLYKSLNEYYAKGTVTEESNEFDIAPTSQDVVEQQNEEAFNNITDNDAPSFEDIADEAMWSEDYESTDNSKVQSPLEDRNIEDVGNRKIKAYQYENPEVRPYFMEEAQNMLYDLNNTIKGERVAIHDEEGYISDWAGMTRQTTEAIAYLKDNYNYSYEQIRKGLNDIIEDNGKENNAVAKRIEFMLDERLREGYTTSDGYPIPPNQEYIKFLEEKQITEYNRAALESLAVDENVPVENNIAPEPQEAPIEPKVLKVDESISSETKEAQKGNTELSDTSVETQEKEQIAKVLSERPTQENKKQRLWAKIRAGIFDKGSVFEDLSIKKKNRELMSKWDYTLTAEARAQNAMMNGTYEYDSTTKERTQVSKSLDDIRTEVGDNVQEFSEYLYHKHNVDRMSLESKAQARMAEIKETDLKEYEIEDIEKLARRRITEKTNEETAELIETAKEYIRLSETKNKPVFGNSVTAEVSQEIVNEYEMNNPEFMDWAKDVYNYNKANLNQLINSGVVSQETADLFDEMYPNYVPIGRANVQGNAINVPLDTNRTGVNAPIARAKGGNQDILPLFDTMARRTIQTYRATAKNNFGVELKKALNSVVDNQQTNLEEVLDNVDQQESLLQEGKNGNAPTFTVFENGEKVTYEITQDMYDALKPISDSSILSTTFKPFNAISNFHRGLLTEYNPVFMLTNAIKDTQDILMNSQHAAKTYVKLPEATTQILKKGYWYQEYMANGGEQNSYFDSQDGTFGKESVADKILPLKAISYLNNMIEMSPRLAEYIASREAGRSVEVSMLDAARVTTNFKAGGDITKWANRNGATFLNASMQGIAQQVRNVREAHAKGLKGYANLATKFALAGVPSMILNSMLWGDDEDYEELSDYVKTNYWIVGKYGDGNFIRIPKGRMVTVIQESFNQMKHLVTGDEQADLGQFLEVLGNNIAPNNPVSDNILSPIVQAVSNKTWYGGDLVPTRLQDVPAAEQYDESTDKLSIAIGQATGISPYKINYVLDQYSGGIGDVFLPMMTEEAEGGSDSLGSKLLAPLVNKFSVDSTMKNQNVSDLYELSDEVTVKANSSNATDNDILQDKYLNAIKTEMNELYKEKREIQNSNLPDSEKYNKVREIQKQINSMAKEATESYEDITKTSNYAKIADKEYYNKNGTWTKVKEEESSELNSMGMTNDQKSTYFNLKSTISEINSSESENKKAEIATAVMNTNLTDEQKAYIYGKNYSSDETLNMVVKGGIDFNEYLSYASQTIMADKDEDGKSISGSRKTKVISAINSLNLSIPQKAMLIRKEYSSFREYNNSIVEYVSSLDIDYSEKVQILNELDIKVDEQGNVYWD